MPEDQVYRLQLMGAFRLSAPDGRALDVRSKKAIALLALLATTDSGERTRLWLQEKLWGSRDVHQAQNSLRRELFNLRRLTRNLDLELIRASARTVRLCLENIETDVLGNFPASPSAEFLEGLEIAGERSFDEWLKAMREQLATQLLPPEETSPAGTAGAAGSAPSHEWRGVTLLIFPFTVQGALDEATEGARSHSFRLFIEHLGRSKYFSISVWPALSQGKVTMTETTDAVERAGASYGLIGQVVTHGKRKDFSLSIFRTKGGEVLWSELVALPGDLRSPDFWYSVQRMVNRTIQIISHEELQRASATDPASLGGTGLSWIIRSRLYNSNKAVFESARAYIDAYLAKYPHEPEPIILDAMYKIVHQLRYKDGPRDEVRLRALARKAILANPTDPRGAGAAAFVEMMVGRLDIAIGYAENAVKMVPGYIDGNCQLGHLYLLDGQLEAGRRTLQHALDLSPDPWRHSYTLSYLALYHALSGAPDKAIDFANQALVVIPDEALPILIKVHCLVGLNRVDEAEQVLLVQGPVVWDRIDNEISGLRFRDPATQDALRQSIQKVVSRTNRMFDTVGRLDRPLPSS